MALKIKLLFLLLFMTAAPMAAQNTTPKDSVREKHDSRYKKLENYSKNKKFTKFIYKLIFRPVKVKEASNTRKEIKNKAPEMKNTFNNYEGRIVRRIKIETLDPFGYSINDTTRKPDSWLHNIGNSVHLKTKQLTIRNLLLIKRNQPLDSLLVKESERLIRTQRYVRRVAIETTPIPGSKDSVDIYVRVLDAWSLTPNGSFSGSRTSFELSERNFLGLGHEFRNDFDKRLNTGETSFLTRYRVPNIMNTYVNATLNYEIWRSYNSTKSFGLDREFFSAYTKWAGGAYVEERLVRDSLPDREGIYALQNFKSKAQDYWAGYSFKIYKGDTEEDRTTRLVTTARYLNRLYSEVPTIAYDSVGFYSSERFFMMSAGLTSRKFVQDKFLFNYDIVEDIPIGKVYSFTTGVQRKNFENRLYLGGKYAFGNLYKWGYFSADVQLGSFFYKERTDQNVLRFGILYFTNIREWGNWRFRHFIKPDIVFGDNRMPIITDQLNINEDNGIPGFDSRYLRGTKKALLTLQTQSYAPWNILGFRLNPFVSVTAGVIGDEQNKLYNSRVYSKIGVGLLIFNDYLVFNSFQLSVAFYPTVPGFESDQSNVFRTNSFKNNDIELPDFQVGKPDTVPYY